MKNSKTDYQKAKAYLKGNSLQYKERFPKDKPRVRMYINDDADVLCRDLELTEHQTELLHNYAATLHPA